MRIAISVSLALSLALVPQWAHAQEGTSVVPKSVKTERIVPMGNFKQRFEPATVNKSDEKQLPRLGPGPKYVPPQKAPPVERGPLVPVSPMPRNESAFSKTNKVDLKFIQAVRACGEDDMQCAAAALHPRDEVRDAILREQHETEFTARLAIEALGIVYTRMRQEQARARAHEHTAAADYYADIMTRVVAIQEIISKIVASSR